MVTLHLVYWYYGSEVYFYISGLVNISYSYCMTSIIEEIHRFLLYLITLG